MSKSTQLVEEVYRGNVEKLYRFFYFKVLNRQVAEDLTSDTFIAFAEKVNSITSDKDTLEKYLYGIARNKWNMYLREQYKNAEYTVEDIDDFSQYVTQEVDTIQDMSLKDRAMTFINMLPTAQKVVAVLRLIDGLLPAEIAQRLDKPINYVKVTLRRALARLRELVASSSISAPGESS